MKNLLKSYIQSFSRPFNCSISFLSSFIISLLASIGIVQGTNFLLQPGKKNMLVFGVNPSTATPGDNNIDPTIRKVRKLTAEDGYDGWIMVNLYPLRATDPKELPQKEDKKLLEKNIKVLKALVKTYRIDAVWAAWGNTIDTRFYGSVK